MIPTVTARDQANAEAVAGSSIGLSIGSVLAVHALGTNGRRSSNRPSAANARSNPSAATSSASERRPVIA